EAAIGIVGTIAFDVVERRKNDLRIRDLVDFAPDDTLWRRHGRRVDAQVEQRRLDRTAPGVRQLAVDPGAPPAIEAGHQGAVEETQIAHGCGEAYTRNGPACKKPEREDRAENSKAGDVSPAFGNLSGRDAWAQC